jgi:hypothetical protein
MQMIVPVMTLGLIMQLTVAVADSVPNFNLEPVCRGIARQNGSDLEPDQSVQHAFKSCLKSEAAMRRQLM